MKTHIYKQIPFAILFPIFLINWLTSADSHPVWIKPLVYGTTIILLVLISILIHFLHFSKKTEKAKSSQVALPKQHFHPSYMISGLTLLPVIAFTILNSSLPTATKAMLILGTFGLILIIFSLTYWKLSTKNKNKEIHHA